MKRDTTHGEPCNNNFSYLLNKFDDCKSKNDWQQLIEEAKQKEPLTTRQRDAIIARCINQINGTFGKTKNSTHLNHTKTT